MQLGCFHPVKIPNPNYDERFPWLTHYQKYFNVPCGKCFACQQLRRKDWYFRAKAEERDAVCSFTVTVTYTDADLPPLEEYEEVDKTTGEITTYLYNPIRSKDVDIWIKRIKRAVPFTVRYFGVGEYGSLRGRPHYHINFFLHGFISQYDFNLLMHKTWVSPALITTDVLSDKSLNYTLKYLLKNINDNSPRPVIFRSQKPYFGSGFLTDSMKRYMKDNLNVMSTQLGYHHKIPKIYRDEVFDDTDKQLIKEKGYEIRQANLDKFIEESKEYDSTHEKSRLQEAQDEFIRRCLRSINKKNRKF